MKTNGGILVFIWVLLLLCPVQHIKATHEVAANLFGDSHIARFIGINDGLPANFVDDLLFDSSGFLWVATSGGGLCRYDGYEFVVMSTGTEPGIKSNFVRNIVEDTHKRLWIGSEWGIELFDMTKSCMTSIDGVEGTAFDHFQGTPCSYITIDSKGCVWASAADRLIRMVFGPDGSVVQIDTLQDHRLEAMSIVFKDVEQNGTIWLGMEGTIYRVSESHNGRLECRVALPALRYNPTTLVTDFIIKDQDAWISTIDGLIRYDLATGLSKLYTTDPNNDKSLTQNYISGLAITPDRQLIAISLKGANLYRPIGDCFERILSEPGQDGTRLLSSNFLNCVSVRADDIWLGTESAGLIQIKPKLLAIQNIRHNSMLESSLAPNPVNAIFETEDGTLMAGTVESGLSYSRKPYTEYEHITTERGALSHNSVSVIESGTDGNLWIGTWGGGVDLLSGTYPYHRIAKPRWEGVQSDRLDYVGAIEADTINNIMWIGTNFGIYCCDPHTLDIYPALTEQPTGCTGSCIDNMGRLWMGSQSGLHIFDLNSSRMEDGRMKFTYTHIPYTLDNPQLGIPDKIVTIMQSRDGTIWVGSNGNGIYRTVESLQEELVFRNITTRDGLVNNCVRCIEEDELGHIWISTENGLSMLSPQDMQFLNYSVGQGLGSPQFYWNASYVCADGAICLGTADGLSIITPSHNRAAFPPLNLHLTKTQVGGQTDYSPYRSLLKLHERDRSIQLSFSTLNYATIKNISYMYRLDGLDKEWYKLGATDNTVAYSSLPAGDYTLQIKATASWGSTMDLFELPIHVKPYLRHTIAAKILLLLLLWGVALYWYKRRTRFLVRQRALLQSTVTERTREINEQKQLLEQKARELDSQNSLLKRQVEELAGSKLLIRQEVNATHDPQVDNFRDKVMEIMRGMYNNPELDVAMFCQAMGMSKTILNKRLQETLGHSVVSLIRTYRLNVARAMIINNRETGTMNIYEIAYECGFNDPKYFSRCFTKEFGVSPSGVVQK